LAKARGDIGMKRTVFFQLLCAFLSVFSISSQAFCKDIFSGTHVKIGFSDNGSCILTPPYPSRDHYLTKTVEVWIEPISIDASTKRVTKVEIIFDSHDGLSFLPRKKYSLRVLNSHRSPNKVSFDLEGNIGKDFGLSLKSISLRNYGNWPRGTNIRPSPENVAIVLSYGDPAGQVLSWVSGCPARWL
jgi:hypothetical protein